jgi:hypothetical protein
LREKLQREALHSWAVKIARDERRVKSIGR